MKNTLIIYCCLVFLLSCNNEKRDDGYRQFYGVESFDYPKGLTFGKAPFKLIEKPIDDNQMVARLGYTLMLYGVAIKYENGNLFIPDSCFEDLDLLWNYTTRAEDKEWFESHISPE